MRMSDSRPQVFGTGLIALDLVMGAEPDAPVRAWAGGTCGNVLAILAYLGWEAYPIGRMNGDPASQRVRSDMKRWGVRLDFAGCAPTSHTPIIIQEIRRGRDGAPTHRFSWACPRCGQWLPGFKAVTVDAVDVVAPKLAGSAVFFMDRLSRASLTLAARASKEGAAVVFEPSGMSDRQLFSEALKLAHVVKYSDQRLAEIVGAMDKESATLVEVQTFGASGLRFRHRLAGRLSTWSHLDAVHAPRVADTCGSGDWCTAGFVARAVVGGQKSLRSGGPLGLRTALRYGQALAAWNCGFEGARGGMYAIERAALELQIDALLSGKVPVAHEVPVKKRRNTSITCPACPPGTPRGHASRLRAPAGPVRAR
jgi:fructokinase